MKTAMQELKVMLENLWSQSDIVTIESIIDFMNNHSIEKEKDQICNSYVEGLEGLYMGAE